MCSFVGAPCSPSQSISSKVRFGLALSRPACSAQAFSKRLSHVAVHT